MNILFLIPFVTIAVIGAISIADIFDFRKRPLSGSMRSPFDSGRMATEVARPGRLDTLVAAWTREIHREDVDDLAIAHDVGIAAGDAACASCAITCDEELIPALGRDELEQAKIRGTERAVGRV